MSINTQQMKEYIVDPVLQNLGLTGSEMMLGIGAQETHMGRWIEQIGEGIHGRGWLSVEAATHDDVWRYLLREDDPNNTKQTRICWMMRLVERGNRNEMLKLCTRHVWRTEHIYRVYHDRLIYDLRYCCAIARLKLYMIPAPLPYLKDIPKMAEYWDKYYNCNDDHGTAEEFVKNYNKYVKPYI